MEQSKALVILSGGQDSATCAAIALQNHSEVHAITFNYGQRHSIEIESATAIAQALNLASHEILDIGSEILRGSSPLISGTPVTTYASDRGLTGGDEIANTFVPSRNALFLTIASNRAVLLAIDTVYTGVCQTDYSGYPDCRRDFIDAIERALSLSNNSDFAIVTPLMELTKAQSVRLALTTLGDSFNVVMELTHTCYQGVKGGCGECAACLLRDKGFNEAGVVDPIWKFRNSH